VSNSAACYVTSCLWVEMKLVNYCMLQLHVCSSRLAVGEKLKLLKVPIVIGTVPLRQQVEDLEADTGEPLLSNTNLRKKIFIHS
jgi:hypothetical protein